MRTMSVEMIPNKSYLEPFVENINNVYVQIKHNEYSPNTEYLFNNGTNSTQSNLNQSIANMEAMEKMASGY